MPGSAVRASEKKQHNYKTTIVHLHTSASHLIKVTRRNSENAFCLRFMPGLRCPADDVGGTERGAKVKALQSRVPTQGHGTRTHTHTHTHQCGDSGMLLLLVRVVWTQLVLSSFVITHSLLAPATHPVDLWNASLSVGVRSKVADSKQQVQQSQCYHHHCGYLSSHALHRNSRGGWSALACRTWTIHSINARVTILSLIVMNAIVYECHSVFDLVTYHVDKHYWAGIESVWKRQTFDSTNECFCLYVIRERRKQHIRLLASTDYYLFHRYQPDCCTGSANA